MTRRKIDFSAVQVWWPTALIVLAAIASVGVLLALVTPFNPETVCCDHIFYRAQASAWAGLGDGYSTVIPPESGLSELYGQFFYDRANGLDHQPPYLYRPFIPLVAGLLGHVTGVNAAFYVVTASMLILCGVFTGLATRALTASPSAGLLAALLAVWLPSYGAFFANNFMLVDPGAIAVSALTVFLMTRRSWTSAALVAAVLAPLVKESLWPLAACVALTAFLNGEGRRRLWILSPLPLAVLLCLRLVLPGAVQVDPLVLWTFAGGYLSLNLFLGAFGALAPVSIGLFSSRVRPWVVGSLPLFIFLLAMNTSANQQELRLWLPYWPFLLVYGLAGLRLASSPIWWAGWASFLLGGAVIGNLAKDGWIGGEWIMIPLLAAIAWGGLQYSFRCSHQNEAPYEHPPKGQIAQAAGSQP